MIEVRIEPKTWVWLDHDVHRGTYLLNKLREAGVPVLGAVWPTGVERGRLTSSTDETFGDLVWEWVP
jgi:hypothetical protein